jgi:hypothetical protein
LADYESDRETIREHADAPIVLAEQQCSQQRLVALLGESLHSLPEKVHETRRITLGRIRGLMFGVVLHPNGAADVSLTGAAMHHGMLSRDARGPRAVLNAVDRIVSSIEPECDRLRSEIANAKVQHQDYERRKGVSFLHETYLAELLALRDRLRVLLSASQTDLDIRNNTYEVAGRIRVLLDRRVTQPKLPSLPNRHISATHRQEQASLQKHDTRPMRPEEADKIATERRSTARERNLEEIPGESKATVPPQEALAAQVQDGSAATVRIAERPATYRGWLFL